jgi:hypothetical protein
LVETVVQTLPFVGHYKVVGVYYLGEGLEGVPEYADSVLREGWVCMFLEVV